MKLTARWLVAGLAVALFAGREVYIYHHTIHPSVAALPVAKTPVNVVHGCPDFRVPGHIDTAGEVHDFEIPGGELRDTVHCFSHESGLTELYPIELASTLTAPVYGRMSSIEALKKMLESTDLTVDENTQPADRSIIFYKASEHSPS